MNYNQNKRIMQMNEQTLIIGVDIAKEKHVARAQDFRGIEFGKALSLQMITKGLLNSITGSRNYVRSTIKITFL